MLSTLSEAKFWSTMDPKPAMYYDQKHNAYIVSWNGLLMTHKQALVIASSIFFNVWPSPKMRTSVFEEFKKLFYSNAFGTKSWKAVEFGPDGHFKYLHSKIYEHYKAKLEDKNIPPQEVLLWFNTGKQHD
jgi:hypothetical protein